MKKLVTALTLALAFSVSAWTATKTVTLSVPGMTACPITVKKALNKVDGVVKTEVSLEKKEATVTYDDAKTPVNTLLDATKNAGYPSSVKR